MGHPQNYSFATISVAKGRVWIRKDWKRNGGHCVPCRFFLRLNGYCWSTTALDRHCMAALLLVKKDEKRILSL